MNDFERKKLLSFLSDVYYFVDFTEKERNELINAYENEGKYNYQLLVTKIKSIIRKKFNSSEKVVYFINKNFTDDNFLSWKEFFASLDSFLDKTGICPSLETWSFVLDSNPVIYKYVESFVNDNSEFVENGFISKFFENNNIILLVKAYTKLNDIEIEDDKNIKSLNNGIDDYFKEISRLPLLTKEEEYELFERLYLGDESARQKLIVSNLKLVVHIAKHYRSSRLPFQDLIEEGNYGLMMAVERFDNSIGTRFSTYAYWWIRQSIKRYVEKHSRTISVPAYLNDKLFKYLEESNNLAIELGRTPTREEISKKMGITYDTVVEFEKVINQIHSTDYIYDDYETEIGQYIMDDFDLEESVTLNLLSGDIEKLFKEAKLSYKELTIIKMRFGFLGRVMTYEEIGKELGVSKQRIKQIEINAFRKLRMAKSIEDFAGYTDCDINSLYFMGRGRTRKNDNDF